MRRRSFQSFLFFRLIYSEKLNFLVRGLGNGKVVCDRRKMYILFEKKWFRILTAVLDRGRVEG